LLREARQRVDLIPVMIANQSGAARRMHRRTWARRPVSLGAPVAMVPSSLIINPPLFARSATWRQLIGCKKLNRLAGRPFGSEPALVTRSTIRCHGGVEAAAEKLADTPARLLAGLRLKAEAYRGFSF
jgi:hypothetical protein